MQVFGKNKSLMALHPPTSKPQTVLCHNTQKFIVLVILRFHVPNVMQNLQASKSSN